MSEVYEPEFIGGPKDGSKVPMPLWVLDKVEMIHHLATGQAVIYLYELNETTKNYIYKGQTEETGGDDE